MKHRSHIAPFLAVLALAALVLAGCGSSSSSGSNSTTTTKDKGSSSSAPSSSSASSGGSSGSSMTIEIKDFKFMPGTIKAKVGDTITFKNEDKVAHTGTSTDAPSKFDTGDIAGGESKEVKVDKAGTYKYECSIHNYMKGTIEVS